MKASDTFHAKGEVSPSFVDLKTGERIPWARRHNTISYWATKAMAAALGGDASLIPDRIGIVFGSVIPSETISRLQTWSDFTSNLPDEDDIQIQPFCCTPTLEKIAVDESSYGYGVTFHMHTDSVTAGWRGGKFSDQTIYQALLLHKNESDYDIAARVSLKEDESYRNKPENFELALDWTVKFF